MQEQPLKNSNIESFARFTKKSERSAVVSRVVVFLLLVLGSIAFMVPLYVMIAMALKTPNEISVTSAWAWPQHPTLANFKLVLSDPNVNFLSAFINTATIAILATLGATLSAAIVAYAFARLEFRGRDRLFMVLLATMMLPGIITLIPNYLIFKELGWVDTLYPLWVPAWLGGGAFNVFLLRQFFMGLPREMDEAAVIDGATNARIFWQLIIPNSKAALTTVGIFAIIYNWRDFQNQLIFLNNPHKQTLEVGLSFFNSLNGVDWNLLMAASVLVMIPLIIIFILGQKTFVKGIVTTGGK